MKPLFIAGLLLSPITHAESMFEMLDHRVDRLTDSYTTVVMKLIDDNNQQKEEIAELQREVAKLKKVCGQ